MERQEFGASLQIEPSGRKLLSNLITKRDFNEREKAI